jgi:hypothetical protein
MLPGNCRQSYAKQPSISLTPTNNCKKSYILKWNICPEKGHKDSLKNQMFPFNIKMF